MFSWRLSPRAFGRRELAAAAAALGCGLIVLLAAHKLGSLAALLLPLGAIVLVAVLLRPLVAVSLAVAGAILCEGEAFGIFTFTHQLYHPVYKHLTALDGLVLLAAASVLLDIIRERRPVRFPLELRLPHVMLALGLLSGIVVGRASGVSTKSLVLAENVTAYLVILPLTVANMRIARRTIVLLLGCTFALAILKALLGLAEIASGKGVSIEGTANLTYYEPTANWLVMLALLGIFGAVLARVRPPLWMLLGTPLLIASLLLSYRRSFWIAAILGLLLVLLLALSPVGRRLLVPSALVLAAAIWLLGSITFQSQSPIVRRAASLSPTSVATNVEDRYRLDERANVIAELEHHPITGLGVLVPWSSAARPLPVEHENGREYVHFAALYLWLKLGIFGLVAYLTLLIATARLSWRVWRESREPIVRCFGLASLCGTAGLLAAETTASFTGVDLRFTVVFGAQIGLLALLLGNSAPPAEAELPVAIAPPRLA
jgi:O-antigen ligase